MVVGNTAEDEGEYIPGDLGAGSPGNLPEGAVDALTAAYEGVKDEEDVSDSAGALGGGKDRGGDREQLRLRPEQEALIKAVSAVNPNTVVVIVSGSAIISVDWADNVGAIIQTFYSGMEGGTALARLLFGEISPSGKLPFTVAKDEADYPFFDKTATSIEYGPLHGYSLLTATQTEPQFAFGHGLSYTTFAYRALKVSRVREGLAAAVSVQNTGAVDADEIVQLYIAFPNNIIERPAPLLKGFERIFIKAGDIQTIHFTVMEEDLKYWDERTETWRLEAGEHGIYLGPSSRREQQLVTAIHL